VTPAPLDRLPPGARVLIIRLRSLGDCVLTTPAIHLLKSYRPDIEIAVAVENRFRGVFEWNPDIARLLGPTKREAFAFRPALALNLHGGRRSVLLTLASMARWRAAYAHLPARWAYNIAIPRAQQILGEERIVHTAEHVASAVFFLGVPRTEIARARLFAAPAPPRPRPYAVIHPFASAAAKAWPAARFAEAARTLDSNHGLTPVIIGATGDDFSPFREFETVEGAPLSDVKSLLAGARVFLGNDSGPAHMAAAFGVPVAVLYGESNPVIWAPWRTENEVLKPESGLGSLALEEVLAAVKRLLLRT
jgi:ADP-heptose:LPS heptosyltransferase